jgi:hypothetical protein
METPASKFGYYFGFFLIFIIIPFTIYYIRKYRAETTSKRAALDVLNWTIEQLEEECSVFLTTIPINAKYSNPDNIAEELINDISKINHRNVQLTYLRKVNSNNIILTVSTGTIGDQFHPFNPLNLSIPSVKKEFIIMLLLKIDLSKGKILANVDYEDLSYEDTKYLKEFLLMI